MRLSDILAIVGVAVATMATTLGLLVPRHVTAESQKKAIKPTIAVPKLTVDGCVFTVSADKLEYAPGEKLVLTVKAVNTSSEPVTTSVSLSVTATSPASMLSRRLVLPTPLWTGECPVNLQPNESRTVKLDTDAALPAGQMTSITMFAKGEAMIADVINLKAALNSR
jgi:hypothetical protein